MGVKRRKKKSLKREWTVSEKHEVVLSKKRGLTLDEIHSLFGASTSAVVKWTRAFDEKGIAGLETAPRGCRAREVSAKRAAAEQVVDEVRKDEPAGGVSKAQGALYRRGFLKLARETVRSILRGKGIGPVLTRNKRRNKKPKPRFFERARPNELWQSDIMSFMLKGQYRVYLIGFLDDHSRFLVSWGLYRFQTTANVLEVFRAGVEKHGLPKEVLTDNGRQYYTWRGKSKFTKVLLKLGIRHIRSRPYHPQTCGKIESFWRNLLQECLTQVPLASFEEAKNKIGEYIEFYNFKRPHQGIGKVMPSDRYYGVAGQVRQMVEQNTARVEEEKGISPEYKPPTYIVGNIGGKELRVVAKDAEVSLHEAPAEEVESGSNGNGNAPQTGADDARSAESLAEPDVNGSPPLEEADRVETVEEKTTEPSGEAGPAASGLVGERIGEGPVPSSGSVPGTVLPVDAQGAPNGAEGSGIEGTGPEASAGRNGAEGPAESAGAHPEAGGEGQGAAQGAGPREAGVDGGQADHPAAGLGRGAEGEG